MAPISSSSPIATSAPRGGNALGFVGRAATLIQAALIVRRQRRALMALDDRMLADIGLSRSQAYGEASRPLTDLPQRMF
jgi:uncharacterized protein YjiS (DUF1127 family)